MTVYEKLLSLLTASNNATGESDTDLTTSTQRLIDGYGSGAQVVTATVDLSNETWENRNFCFGQSSFVLTCNKFIEVPANTISAAISVQFSGNNRCDSCIQCFATKAQQDAYDVTDSSSYTNNDYADEWTSNSDSVHNFANMSGRYSFALAVARYPISSYISISSNDLVSCTVTFYYLQIGDS